MLHTDHRTLYADLLRPPSGFDLDVALGTTFSLDLETLLLVPLQLLSLDREEHETLFEDPFALLQGIQEAAHRVLVFYQADRIRLPPSARAVYSWLEGSVVPVVAPKRKGRRGAFHPKLWVLRFVRGQERAHRVVVLSRNLSFDSSWDVVLAADGVQKRNIQHQNDDLVRLVRRLPDFASRPIGEAQQNTIETLAEELRRVYFPAPQGFSGAIRFHTPGLTGRRWDPKLQGSRLLIISPFVSGGALKPMAEQFACRRLISRVDQLDAVKPAQLDGWEVSSLRDELHSESDDEELGRRRGLHAKLYVTESGYDYRWLLGSANCTSNAFDGVNIEVMAELTSRKWGQARIEALMEGGLEKLCQPYSSPDDSAELEDERRVKARKNLQAARLQVGDAALSLSAEQGERGWSLHLLGDLVLRHGIRVRAHPVSIGAAHAQMLSDSGPLASFSGLSPASLVAFLAFQLELPEEDVPPECFVLKLPTRGFPEDRDAHVLRSLFSSPEEFLQLVRALLGKGGGAFGGGGGGSGGGTGSLGSPDSLALEDLLQVAARDPAKLQPVRRMVNELMRTEDGRALLRQDFLRVWQAVDEAIPS